MKKSWKYPTVFLHFKAYYRRWHNLPSSELTGKLQASRILTEIHNGENVEILNIWKSGSMQNLPQM